MSNTKQRVLIFYLILMMSAAIIMAATSTDITMTWVVPANVSYSIAYGGSCSASTWYFVEGNCLHDGIDTDGNGAKCMPLSATIGTNVACQSTDLAPVSITNNGNISFNLDGNWPVDLNGTDTNLALKVWLASTTGCGTDSFGGWAKDCTVTGTNPVTATTCRQYWKGATNTSPNLRLVNTLLINDNNKLCFSGDFNGFETAVTQGNHPVIFRVSAH